MARRGINRHLLADKLHERWLFERHADALYGEAIDRIRPSDERAELEHHLERQQRHKQESAVVLARLLTELGHAPAPLRATPEAAIVETELDGLLELCRSPLLTTSNVLQILLTMELIDEAGWRLLVSLARGVDLEESWFRALKTAMSEQEEHVYVMRTRLEKLERQELVGAPT